MPKNKRDKFQQLSMPVVDAFLSIEEQILINIAKRLKKHQSLLTEEDYQSWQLEQLGELGDLRRQNIKVIAKHSGMTIKEVIQMLQNSGYSTVKEQEAELQAGVAAGILMQAPQVEESPALESIVNAYAEQAKDSFNLINGTMLNQADQAYTDIINNTVGKLLSGSITPQQALRESVREWADMGIPALIDKAGRKWSTEAYVSTVTRSMSNHVANDMQDKRFEEYGVDIIEVSSHIGARPRCAPFQGRLFSLSGNSSEYPAFSTTSYGEPAGLFGKQLMPN